MRYKNWVRRMIPDRIKQFVAYSPEVEYGRMSFSQFGEDMILRNFFLGKEHGFYVDIGAHEPIHNSNTYFFYKQGWSGIVIDPIPGAQSRFNAARPRDTALEIGISDVSGHLEYYHFRQPLENTFSSSRAEQVMKTNPLQSVTKVAVRRLDEILDQHLPPGTPIDFFSVDVEGHDLEVLQSNNWDLYRPSFVVVENIASDPAHFEANPIFTFLRDRRFSLVAFTHIDMFFKQQP